jgi:hypothetical protein
LQIGSAATESILHDYLGLRKVTCRWVPHFLTEAQRQGRVDYSLAMKAGFSIMIQRRSVKVKFGLQAMILFLPKFVGNVLLANTGLQSFL